MRSIAFQQWLRSAISDSQQPNSLIGFLFLKLPPPPCVVLLVSIYVALCHIHLRFAWQAWRLVTPTFVLRGRRGTCGTGLALVSHAIFVTYHLSHTFSHTIFDTPSFKTLSHTSHLCHNIFHTLSFTHPLSHPTLSHTIFDTPSFTHHIVTHHL